MTIPLMPLPSFGSLMRDWRQRRHLSQLALALRSNVSQRHLSFVESGRAEPSREMVLRLAEQLEVPLRHRNQLLLAAGFAPVYPERTLGDPALAPARSAIVRVLAGHEPFPALAVDRHWNLLDANRAARHFLAGVNDRLLQPPINVLRLSLHPDGLAPRIENFTEWREHLLARLDHQAEQSGDPELRALLGELRSYAAPRSSRIVSPSPDDVSGIIVPFRLRTGDGELLSFISTTTVFGTPTEVTLSEIALECFFPADETTAEHLRRLSG